MSPVEELEKRLDWLVSRGIRGILIAPFAIGPDLVRLIRDQRAQLLAGLEDRNRPRGHFDRLAGARIPRHTRFPSPDLEGAESTHLDVVLLFERALDRVEERVDNAGTVFLGNHGPRCAGDRGGHLFDEIGLGHASPRRVMSAEANGRYYELTRCLSRAWVREAINSEK